MKTMSEHVQEILWRYASPAMPLSILVEALERETIAATGGPDRVLRELRNSPDLFRVLDPRVGPWRGRWAITGGAETWTPDLWVLGLRPHKRPCSPVRARLSETLRSLGRRVDQGSAMATARWWLLMERESTVFVSSVVALGFMPES
jgi:hypothetical protein